MLTDKAVKAARPASGNKYRKLADQGGLYLFCTVDSTRSELITPILAADTPHQHN